MIHLKFSYSKYTNYWKNIGNFPEKYDGNFPKKIYEIFRTSFPPHISRVHTSANDAVFAKLSLLN